MDEKTESEDTEQDERADEPPPVPPDEPPQDQPLFQSDSQSATSNKKNRAGSLDSTDSDDWTVLSDTATNIDTTNRGDSFSSTDSDWTLLQNPGLTESDDCPNNHIESFDRDTPAPNDAFGWPPQKFKSVEPRSLDLLPITEGNSGLNEERGREQSSTVSSKKNTDRNEERDNQQSASVVLPINEEEPALNRERDNVHFCEEKNRDGGQHEFIAYLEREGVPLLAATNDNHYPSEYCDYGYTDTQPPDLNPQESFGYEDTLPPDVNPQESYGYEDTLPPGIDRQNPVCTTAADPLEYTRSLENTDGLGFLK